MKLKLFALMFVVVLLIGSVSAFEFDNVRDYDSKTRTITITNAFGVGDVIGKAKLITPLNVRVGSGYQKVAEFDIWAYQDYNEAIKQFTFTDLNKKEKVNREFDIKYLTTEEVEVFDYDMDCSNAENSEYSYLNYDCVEIVVGSHFEIKDVWKKVTPANLKKDEKLTIGIFTDVQIGDYVDWVPTIYGVEIPEWASWTQSLNVDLVTYYKLDETIGTDVFNEIIVANAIASEDTGNLDIPGIINTAFDFNGTNYISQPDDPILDLVDDFTINAWIKWDGQTDDFPDIIEHGAHVNGNINFIYGFGATDGVLRFSSYDSEFRTFEDSSATVFPNGDWAMGTIVVDTTNNLLRFYVNGVSVSNVSYTFTPDTSTENLYLGKPNGGGVGWTGGVDEVGIWNRTLTPEEITNLYNSGSGITYSNISVLDINLIFPIDSAVTINQDIIFNANVTVSVESDNLVNMTLFLYNSIGDLINDTETNIISGNTTNSSSFNFVDIDFGNYLWNVFACATNSTGDPFCNFAENNFTFLINQFAVESQSFNNNVLETNSESFQINISTIENVLSLSSKLNYNGTSHQADTSCNATGFCTSNIIIDIPLITSDDTQNKSFFWEINIFDGSSEIASNTTIEQQNITKIFLELCNSTHTIKTLNFTAVDEINLTQLSNFKFDSTFNFWIGGGDVKRNNTYSTNGTEINLCMKDNLNYSVDSKIDYDEFGNTTTYTSRFYYMQDKGIDNTLEDIPLYLLQSAFSTSFILKVQDQNLLPVEEALINIQRCYAGEPDCRTVQIAKTDENGKSIGFFQTETVDYKFIIVKDGVTLLETGTQKVVPESSPFTLTFNVGQDLGAPWKGSEDIPSLNSTLIFNKTSGIVTYIYIDTSTNFTLANLTVTRNSLSNSSATVDICSETSTLSSSTIICDVGNTTGFYTASAYITRSGTALDIQISFQIENVSSIVGFLGLFYGFFLILVIVFMFKFNEIAGIWLLVVSIVLLNITGLIKFGMVFVTAIIVLAIIITWLLER